MLAVADYDVHADATGMINEGGFGKVYRAQRRTCAQGQQPVAVAAKRVPLKNAEAIRATRQEVEVMKKLSGEGERGHSSIIRLHEYHELNRAGNDEGWLIMELATGGELFDLLMDFGRLSEREARPYIRSIVDGLAYMHGLGVVHRDIKLENVMLCGEDELRDCVKLIDFGLATCLDEPNTTPVKGRVGSKSYRAPEILRARSYLGPPVDVWALGITAFSLLAGFFPMEEASDADWRYLRLEDGQQKGMGACDTIYATYKRTCNFSPALKQLLDGMLTIDVKSRIGIAAVAAHAWLAEEDTKPGVHRGGALDEFGDEDGEMSRALDLTLTDDPQCDLPLRASRQRAVVDPD